ncbi:conserved hypothetical protein [Gammaproteobacteria bacterium]
MASHLFCFSAKGLQSYIMRGGKLRDMTGATSLIDKLSTESELEKWFTTGFGISKTAFEILQSAAGSARIKFSDDVSAFHITRFWPLWCHQWAPGLEVVQHLEPWEQGEGYAKVAARAAKALETKRNFPMVQLPEVGPFVKRAPRTGEPAVLYDHAKEEWIDLATARKRDERNSLKKQISSIEKTFGFTSETQIPHDFSDVAGKAYLAIVHADGNRLGQMFLEVGQAMENGVKDEIAIPLFKYLSHEVVAEGTREAVRITMAELAKDWGNSKWPLVPLVLAGDDVTVVCRADVGLPFAETFLKEFRKEMETRLGAECLKKQPWWKDVPKNVQEKIPKALSAGAGIVFCTNHYPFSLAYELCEDVAKQAKNCAKKILENDHSRVVPPSALSFVRISGATAPKNFSDLERGILRGSDNSILTGCPYFLDSNDAPQYADLLEVYKLTRPAPTEGRGFLPSTSLRDLLKLQRTEAEKVQEAVERIKEVAGGNDKKASDQKKAWNTWEKAWKKLCGIENSDWQHLRFHRSPHGERDEKDSPLLDLLTLLAIQKD